MSDFWFGFICGGIAVPFGAVVIFLGVIIVSIRRHGLPFGAGGRCGLPRR